MKVQKRSFVSRRQVVAGAAAWSVPRATGLRPVPHQIPRIRGAIDDVCHTHIANRRVDITGYALTTKRLTQGYDQWLEIGHVLTENSTQHGDSDDADIESR